MKRIRLLFRKRKREAAESESHTNENIVFVRLENKREYCFLLPPELIWFVKTGSHVLCDTSKGRIWGVVTHPPIGGTGAVEKAKRKGATFPLRQIVACRDYKYPVADIVLPHYLQRSRPRAVKLERRMHEYIDKKQFNTKVKIAADGTLLDGYTAYLVCKMWDIKKISAVIYANNK